MADNLTGLIWTRDAGTPGTVACPGGGVGCSAGYCAGAARTWQQALDYVACLNANNHLGRTWRLPNINELKSIVNVGQSTSLQWLTARGFANLQSANYWSSTSGAVSPSGYAWALKFDDEIVDYDGKSNTYYVWPVSGGQSGTADPAYPANIRKTGQVAQYDANTSKKDDGGISSTGVTWPSPRFTDNGDQTITDTLTGLIWAKDAGTQTYIGSTSTCTGGAMHWPGAGAIPLPLSYVACLNANNYLNHDDWRLPNINELQSLVDYSHSSPALPAGHLFTGAQSQHYWSSTAHGDSTGDAWSVDFSGGGVYYGDRAPGSYVWPVRGGIISVNTVPHISPFERQLDVALNTSNTPVTSNSVTVSSINAPVGIRVGSCTSTQCEYSINNSGFTSAAGTVKNGDTVVAKQIPSSSYYTFTDAGIISGGVEKKFSVRTMVNPFANPPDSNPDSFSFSHYSLTDVAPSGSITSENDITVTGIGSSAPISIHPPGSMYSVSSDGGLSWSSFSDTTPANVNLYDQVMVQQTASHLFSTTTTATLTIGGTSGTFSVTTEDPYAVTLSAGANGTICSAYLTSSFLLNATPFFTIMPDPGYYTSAVTGCQGTLFGDTYTTGQLTTDCTVSATFAASNPAHNVPTGNVSITPLPEMSISFENVTTPGVLTVTQLLNPSLPPANFRIVGGLSYDIDFSPSNAFTGNARICIDYDPTNVTAPQILHNVGTVSSPNWLTLTMPFIMSISTTPPVNRICADTATFSEFAVAEPQGIDLIPNPKFTFTYSSTQSYVVNFSASSASCPSGVASCTYDWTFGDGGTASGMTASHTYANTGPYTATLKVTTSSNTDGSIFKPVTPLFINQPPVASFTLSFDANTWTATVTDTSTDDLGIKPNGVTIRWGDGKTDVISAGGSKTHTYTAAGTYTITELVIDSATPSLSAISAGQTVNAAAFTVSGTVSTFTGGNPSLANGVLISLMQGGVVKANTFSSTTGNPATYSFTNVKAGTYDVRAAKSGYEFAAPIVSVTAGPNGTANFTLKKTLFKATTTVTATGTGASRSGVTIKVYKGTTLVAQGITNISGLYATGMTLKAGTYTAKGSKLGYTCGDQTFSWANGEPDAAVAMTCTRP